MAVAYHLPPILIVKPQPPHTLQHALPQPIQDLSMCALMAQMWELLA
jgi:hypothetical protein